MRTYSRDDWQSAQDQWRDFSSEWREVRHQAAMRGILYPPSGDKHDSWEDDSPSQRAILIRAIRETPKLLEQCVARSRSWSQVIGLLTAARDDWRAELAEREREVRRRAEEERPRSRTAPAPVADTIDRLADSLGVQR